MNQLNDDEYKQKAKDFDESLDSLLPGDSVFVKFIGSLDIQQLDNKKYLDAKQYEFFRKQSKSYSDALFLGYNYEAWKQNEDGI